MHIQFANVTTDDIVKFKNQIDSVEKFLSGPAEAHLLKDDDWYESGEGVLRFAAFIDTNTKRFGISIDYDNDTEDEVIYPDDYSSEADFIKAIATSEPVKEYFRNEYDDEEEGKDEFYGGYGEYLEDCGITPKTHEKIVYTNDKVRRMLLGVDELVIPKHPDDQYYFLDTASTNLWYGKNDEPAVMDLVVKGFYKVLCHPSVDIRMAKRRFEGALYGGGYGYTADQARKILIDDHPEEYAAWEARCSQDATKN